MLRFIPGFICFAAVSTLCAGGAHAEMKRYEFDKAHTQIVFFADHLGFSKSSGKFLDFDGSFNFDDAAPETSSVDVSIKTASIDMGMGMERWNEHLKNPDFFNVEKFPEMSFKSASVKVTGEKTADITGDLTLLGQTHPVVLHTTFNKAGQHPMTGAHMVGFSATAMLDRTQWGMTYGIPMMGPDVEIRIQVEASPADEAAQGAVNK